MRITIFQHIAPPPDGVGGSKSGLRQGCTARRGFGRLSPVERTGRLGEPADSATPPPSELLGVGPSRSIPVNQQWIRDMGHFGTGACFVETGSSSASPENGARPYFGGARPRPDRLPAAVPAWWVAKSARSTRADRTTCGFAERSSVQIYPNIKVVDVTRWATRRQRRLPGHYRNTPGEPTSQPTDPPPVASSSLAERWARTNCWPTATTADRCLASATGGPVVRTDSRSVLTRYGCRDRGAGGTVSPAAACMSMPTPTSSSSPTARGRTYSGCSTVLVGDGTRVSPAAEVKPPPSPAHRAVGCAHVARRHGAGAW